MDIRLTFHGGAQSVTGSNYLLEADGTKILIDCGMHQGSSYCEAHNFEPFPYQPREIAAVFVTHAHIDHTGRLPQLVKSGFQGTIYSTHPTKDMGEFLLLDSEHIMREEAEHKKTPPLYTGLDVEKTMAVWRKIGYHTPVTVGPFTVEFYDAGHILGSSSAVVRVDGKTIAFSGDLGNVPSLFIKPTEYIPDADYALVESTYGNRIHERGDKRINILEDVVEEAIQSRGVLMIPAFALERTQEMIFELNELVKHGSVPRVPVFVDSPLAIRLTGVYQKYSEDPEYFNDASIKLVKKGDLLFDFPGLTMTLTTEQSKAINDIPPPKVVVAGAGMSNAGRILHHERRYLPDPASTILFVGYQAGGTLGRMILDGASTVKMFGETVPIRCRRRAIGGYSAHADQPQLMAWVSAMREQVKRVFVVQGEASEAGPLAQRIRDELAVNAQIPSAGESVVL